MISMRECEKKLLLLLEYGYCLREQALSVCRLTGLKERQGFQATSLETLVRLVSSGAGITVLLEMAVASYTKDVAITAISGPVSKRVIGMAWLRAFVRELCCKKIITVLKKN